MILNYHIHVVIILQYEHLMSLNDQKFTLLRKSVINKFDKVQQNMGKEDELLNLVTCNDNG